MFLYIVMCQSSQSTQVGAMIILTHVFHKRRREARRRKDGCFWVIQPAEPAPGVSPGMDNFGVCRGHPEKDWCSYLIFLRAVSLSQAPWDTLPCPSYLAEKPIVRGGWCFLAGGQRRTAGLPFNLLFCLSPCLTHECPLGTLRSISFNHLLMGKLRSGGYN